MSKSDLHLLALASTLFLTFTLPGSVSNAWSATVGNSADDSPNTAIAPKVPRQNAHSIVFARCGKEVRAKDVRKKGLCGTITVPEDRTKPNGRQLQLPIIKIPALTEARGAPIFVLNGGPGQSNLPGGLVLKPMHAEHDVYFIGYRGADGSSILRCPEVNAAMAAQPLNTPAAKLALRTTTLGCVKQLTASGIDLQKYTVFDVVDDLEAVANKLGIAKINLASVSYGTRVAQYYARRHPGRIQRSAMFGANPPGHFVFSAEVNDKVITRLSAICAEDAVCSAYTKDLKRTIHLALTAGQRSGNPRIQDETTRLALFTMLYGRDETLLFLRAAVMAEMGDTSLLEQARNLVRAGTNGMIVGDLLSKGAIDAYRYEQMRSTFPLTETSMGSPFDELLSSLSAGWPTPITPDQYLRAATDPTPTLVVNGDLDVSTPLVFIENELMPYLPNGKLVILKDYSHFDFMRQQEAIGRMTAKFFGDGSVDQSQIVADPFVFPKP